MMVSARLLASCGAGLLLTLPAVARALDHGPPPTEEGEIDTSVLVSALWGDARPGERESGWMEANTEVLELGVGYNAGSVGPLEDFYVRVEGAYFTSAQETVERSGGPLPRGYLFHPADNGGWISALVSSKMVSEPRWSFGLFASGTIPLHVDLDKFSGPHLHYFGGGSTFDAYLTDPAGVASIALSTRLFLGSGAWADDDQHNASISSTTLVELRFARWVLPWRVGLRAGPYLEADVNEHVDRAYAAAYVAPGNGRDDGAPMRETRLALALMPYLEITHHAVIELGFVQTLTGYDLPYTQRWMGGLRSRF